MSTRAREWAAAQLLTTAERAVLNILTAVPHEDDLVVWVGGLSQFYLSMRTGLSKDAVRQALARMRKDGLISWNTGRGSGANIYTLNIAGPTQPSLIDEVRS